jgi:hypothetical protein
MIFLNSLNYWCESGFTYLYWYTRGARIGIQFWCGVLQDYYLPFKPLCLLVYFFAGSAFSFVRRFVYQTASKHDHLLDLLFVLCSLFWCRHLLKGPPSYSLFLLAWSSMRSWSSMASDIVVLLSYDLSLFR